MIIINNYENVVLFSEKLCSINIHTDRKRIMANYADASIRPGILGIYQTPERCDRAFGLLVRALEEGKDYYRMPRDEEVMSHITNSANFRKIKTAGKTK